MVDDCVNPPDDEEALFGLTSRKDENIPLIDQAGVKFNLSGLLLPTSTTRRPQNIKSTPYVTPVKTAGSESKGWSHRLKRVGYMAAIVLRRSVSILLRTVQLLWVWLAVALALLALAFLFELFYPFDTSPEDLAKRAVDSLTVLQQWVDFFLFALRMFFSVLRPLVPLWNAFSQYVFQPVVFISMEIVSMLIPPFFHHDSFFVMPRVTDDAPYRGFSCAGSLSDAGGLLTPEELAMEGIERAYTSMAWCGILGWYEGGKTAMISTRRLRERITERNGGRPPHTITDAESLRDAAGSRVVFPLQMLDRVTRRLADDSEDFITKEGQTLDNIERMVSVNVRQIAIIVSQFAGLGIELLGSIADIFFHVVYVLLDDVIEELADIVVTLFRVLSELFMSLVKSGALTRILKMGLDVLMIAILDITIPMIFLVINSMMCLFHLFNPSSWGRELRCIHKKCDFSNIHEPDLIVFTSIYLVLDDVFKIVQDTFSAGSRLFGLGSLNINGAKFWSKTEATGMNASTGCASCFVCKVRGTPP